jgi:methylated-DNA-protein-cysteine methyltransferase related protein
MGVNTAIPSLAETIWQWVAAIPPGKVASYGQIAKLAGYPSHARYVGTTLRHLPKGTTLPWFRVLRSSGELAFPPSSAAWKRQQTLLAQEGVIVSGFKVSLKRYRWELT